MILPIIAICCYGLATILVYRLAQGHTASRSKGGMHRLLMLCIGSALITHGCIVFPDLALGSHFIMLALSLAAWTTTAIYLCICVLQAGYVLGLIVLPLCALTVLLTPVDTVQATTDSMLAFHLLLALPAYALLSLAFVQALFVVLQERQLSNPSAPPLIKQMPAMESMERTLFALIFLGFAMMTVNLGIGMMSSYRQTGQPLSFNHHILFAIITWLCLGALIFRRIRHGLRGLIAAKWTAWAYVLLILAYFGTRLVRNLLL